MWRALVLLALCASQGGHTPAADPAPPPPVTAVKLVETFITNEALADEKYVGKEVEITGKLSRIYRPDKGTSRGYVLEFEIGDAGKGVRYDLNLLVHFDESDRAALAKLKLGQNVRVRGECSRRIIYQLEPRNPAKCYSEVEVRKALLVPDIAQ